MNTKKLMSIFTLGLAVGFLGLGVIRWVNSSADEVNSASLEVKEKKISKPVAFVKKAIEVADVDTQRTMKLSKSAESDGCEDSLQYALDDHSHFENDMSGQQILTAEMGEAWVDLVSQQSEFLDGDGDLPVNRFDFEQQQKSYVRDFEDMEKRGLVSEVRF